MSGENDQDIDGSYEDLEDYEEEPLPLDPEDILAMIPSMEEELFRFGLQLLLEDFLLDDEEFRDKLRQKAEDLGFLAAVECQLGSGELKDRKYRELQERFSQLEYPDREEGLQIMAERQARLRELVEKHYIEKVFDQLWPRLRRQFLLTDLGNGERFVAEHKEDVRFCPKRNTWYLWNGQRWVEDDTRQWVEIKQKAKETVRRIKAEAEATKDGDLGKYWESCDKPSKLMSMLKAAAIETEIQIKPEEFDSPKWLLNCENGTVRLDIPSGVSRHERADFQTRMVPWPYVRNEKCPLWMKFLSQVTGGDSELERFLQRVVGYGLTGEITEKCLFFLLGPTNTGKTTFVETIREMMGKDYATTTDFASFVLERSKGSIRNDLARIQNKRFVAATEASKGQRFDAVVIKRITGADTIIARFLYKEFDEFKPEVKIFLAANHGPKLEDDDSVWNRFVVIPFDVQVREEEKDKNLMDHFRDEMPGILAWAVRGARLYYHDNYRGKKPLELPIRVEQAIEQYRSQCEGNQATRPEQVLVNRFVEQCCDRVPAEEETPESLYTAFKHWCEENYEEPIKENMLGRKLTACGFKSGNVTRGGVTERVWHGIRLKKEWKKIHNCIIS